MAVDPKKMREIVFQLLYSRDMGDATGGDLLDLMAKELAVSKSAVRLALAKVDLLQVERGTIDASIAATARSYAFDRIPHVERNILRLGVYELINEKEIPAKVVIAEAIRLARKFATPESASFINAVLDNMHKAMLGENAPEQAIKETIAPMEKEEASPPSGKEEEKEEEDAK